VIIVWRGMGGIVLIVGILVSLIVNIVTSSVYEEPNYFQSHLWPKLLALLLCGAICWFLGRYLNSRPGIVVVDAQTGQQTVERPYHHLFFLKMEYWGLVYWVVAVVVLVWSLRP
jgi:hypothetical protein